jgi:DNA-binding transcriptional ArsR family regulator
MNSATPVTKAKAVRRPTCPQCKKRFRTTSTVKAYCNTACQKAANKQKRRINQIDRATNSAFMYVLAAECERAETLHVLQQDNTTRHDAASLAELYGVYKRYLRANEYGDTRDYAMSHIHPVRGQSGVGLFHADNLVIAPSDMNRSHSTKYFGHGLSVPRAKLESRHRVHRGDSRAATIKRIVKFLGEDVITEFAKAVNLQPSTRHKTLSWLHDHLDPSVPEHAEHLAKLDGMSSKALTTLKATLQGKDGKGFKLMTQEVHPLDVFATELQRHAVVRTDLEALATFITECTQRVNHREHFIYESSLLPDLFAVLHGKELADVAVTLVPVLQHMKALGKIKLDVPTATPVVVVMPDAPVIPAAPVRVLQTFTSFAEEVDGYVPDALPSVFQAHTVTYEVEALPWD